MLSIALIDDKNIGIPQIVAALPADVQYHMTHFQSYAEFAHSTEKFQIILLDYYLDTDQMTADQIYDKVAERAEYVISFSSSELANAKMQELGAPYAVQKVWSGKNDALENIFLELAAMNK